MKCRLFFGNTQPSATVNGIMYFLMKISGMLLSFISYPHIFRVLGAAQYGKVAFATAILNILVIFANLGIPVYGIRECAKVRDDKRQLMKVSKELLCIQSVMSLAVFAVLLLMILFSPQLRAEPVLFLLQGAAIVSQMINTEWLYAALEQYGYIAIRTSAVKAFFVVLMFLLVRDSSAYLVYAALVIGPIVVSNVINLLLIHSVGRFEPGMDWRRVRSHLKPVILFFTQAVAISIYTNIDSVMLGFSENSYSVGIYDTAIKIKLVLSYAVTSLSSVMLPKMSYYLSNNEEDRFYEGVLRTMQFSAAIAIPLWFLMSFAAEDILLLLFGSATDAAVIALRMLLPTILLIGFSNIAGVQMLVPMGRERQAVISYLIGAVVDVVCNALFIPRWSIMGAAAATLLAELVVLTVQLYFLRREAARLLGRVGFIRILCAAALACPVILCFQNKFSVILIRLLVMGVAYGLLFLALLWGADKLQKHIGRKRKGILSEMDIRHGKLNQKIIYLLIAVVSLLFMQIHAADTGFWYDEFAQICYSGLGNSLWETVAAWDPTPPLFSLIANVWMQLVPYGERWLLLLPQLAVAAAAVMMGVWTEENFGKPAGILSAFFIGTSQIIIEQCGFEFRGYGLYLLIAVLVFAMHDRWMSTGGRQETALFAAALAGLLYAHIFGAGIIAVMCFADLILYRRQKSCKVILIPYLCAFTVFLPWLAGFLIHAGAEAALSQQLWMTTPTLWEVIKLFGFLCGNNPLIFLLFGIGVIKTAAELRGVKTTGAAAEMTRKKAFLVLVSIISVAGVFCYGMLQPDATLWVKRYFIGLMPCCVFIMAGTIGWCFEMKNKKPKPCRMIAFALTVFCILTGAGSLYQVAAGNSPFTAYYHREAAEVLLAQDDLVAENTVILSTLGEYAEGWKHYYLTLRGAPERVDVRSIYKTNPEQLRKYQVVYVDNGFPFQEIEVQDVLDREYVLEEAWKDVSLVKYRSKNG